jgi:hypothetical protein
MLLNVASEFSADIEKKWYWDLNPALIFIATG